MTFFCKISNLGIKSFAQAINSCCKLGEDIYLDATPSQLTIKVLNEPYKSAFMMVSFDNEFFEAYQVEGRLAPNDDNSIIEGSQSNGNRSVNNRDAKVTCKLKTRSCLLAFKKEKTLAKNLDHCEIRIRSSHDSAQFKFTYNSKCVKTMDLPLGGDGLDVLDDIFQRGKHKVTCKSRILADILTYFAKEDEYITMKAMPQSIDFETHFVDRDKSGKLTKTNIDIDEFDAYNVSEEIFLTFSLRLIRPFLAFCSNRIPELDIFMDGSNQPICFNAEFPPHIRIALALATLDVNHPTATRNSSKSSVMYQTTRSSVEGATSAAASRRRFSTQSRPSIAHSQNSRSSQSSWNQNADPNPIDERVISNEEQHTSVGGPRDRSRVSYSRDGQRVISATPPGNEDVDMIVDDNIFTGDDELDDQVPSNQTKGRSSRISSCQDEDINDVSRSYVSGTTQRSASLSQQLHLSLSNGNHPQSTPNNPSTPTNYGPRPPDSYWMSLPLDQQDLDDDDEILCPATDPEESTTEESSDSDTESDF